MLWKYDAGADIEATVVVSDGIAYFGDAEEGFHAVRMVDGNRVWRVEFEETGFIHAAALAKDRLFVSDYFGALYCLSRDQGRELWRLEEETLLFAGAVASGGAVLVASENGGIVSVDAATGGKKWNFTVEGEQRSGAPTLSGRYAMLAGCDGKLHTVDVSTGQEAGAVDIGGPTGAIAAVAGKRVYFGTESGVFYAADASDPAAPRIDWTYEDRRRRGQRIRGAAAVTEETVVFCGERRIVYRLNAQNGEVLWESPTRSRVDSSPVIAGERVAVATSRGRVLLLDLETGDSVWEYDAGGAFKASPVVVEGRLVIGNTDGTLYCFGAKKD